MKLEREEVNTVIDDSVNAEDEVEIVSEGTVLGGSRARSLTIKPDPMTTDEEDNMV